MIIVNKKPLNVSEALNSKTHPLHKQAQEYDQRMTELRKRYKDGKLSIVRTGFPKFVDALSAEGKELRDVPEPTPPAFFPF